MIARRNDDFCAREEEGDGEVSTATFGYNPADYHLASVATEVVLTTELEEKTVELEDMRQVKKTMETVVEERSDSGGKTLTMADSVLVGDALFGSTKIDSQIINDPLAIARAAIDAYREGKKDADDA